MNGVKSKTAKPDDLSPNDKALNIKPEALNLKDKGEEPLALSPKPETSTQRMKA